MLDLHFNRRERFSPEEKQIYIKALQEFSIERLDVAFQRALHECVAMPRIADIEQRLPEEKEFFEPNSAAFVSVKDWYEPYTSTAKLRVWQDARGNKRVAIVKLQPGEKPPRIACEPEDYEMSLDEMWAKLRAISASKSMNSKKQEVKSAQKTEGQSSTAKPEASQAIVASGDGKPQSQETR